MTLSTPPNNEQNASYSALVDRQIAEALLVSGGVYSLDDMRVKQATVPAMSVVVGIGGANIIGSGAGSGGVSAYQTYNDAEATVVVTTADPTNPRIDLLCITVRDTFYGGAADDVRFVLTAGTPSATPAVPATPANSIVLAEILVGAAVTTITDSKITDKRKLITIAQVSDNLINSLMGAY